MEVDERVRKMKGGEKECEGDIQGVEKPKPEMKGR